MWYISNDSRSFFFLDIFFCRHKFYLSLKHIQSGQYRRYSSADVPMVRSRWQMAFNQTEFLSGHEVWSGSVLSATRPCVSVRAPSIFSFLYWKYDFCWQNCTKTRFSLSGDKGCLCPSCFIIHSCWSVPSAESSLVAIKSERTRSYYICQF